MRWRFDWFDTCFFTLILVVVVGFVFSYRHDAKLDDRCKVEFDAGNLSYECAKHIQYVPPRMIPMPLYIPRVR